MSLTNPLFNEAGGFSWKDLFIYHASRGRYLLFLDSQTDSLNWSNSSVGTVERLSINQNLTFLQYPHMVFAFFSYFASTSQWLVVYHLDLFMNVVALLLWCATSQFINNLQDIKWDQAILNYETLKLLTRKINAVAGTVVLTYTIDSILFYAGNLEVLFKESQWFGKIVVIHFMLSALCWLYFSSSACLMVRDSQIFIM